MREWITVIGRKKGEADLRVVVRGWVEARMQRLNMEFFGYEVEYA